MHPNLLGIHVQAHQSLITQCISKVITTINQLDEFTLSSGSDFVMWSNIKLYQRYARRRRHQPDMWFRPITNAAGYIWSAIPTAMEAPFGLLGCKKQLEHGGLPWVPKFTRRRRYLCKLLFESFSIADRNKVVAFVTFFIGCCVEQWHLFGRMVD